MTFEEFQATRQSSNDVSKTTGYDYGDDLRGYVYIGGLHIFDAGSQYQLLIMGEEKVSSDLAALERDLYDFGIEEGVIAPPSREEWPSPMDHAATPFADNH